MLTKETTALIGLSPGLTVLQVGIFIELFLEENEIE